MQTLANHCFLSLFWCSLPRGLLWSTGVLFNLLLWCPSSWGVHNQWPCPSSGTFSAGVNCLIFSCSCLRSRTLSHPTLSSVKVGSDWAVALELTKLGPFRMICWTEGRQQPSSALQCKWNSVKSRSAILKPTTSRWNDVVEPFAHSKSEQWANSLYLAGGFLAKGTWHLRFLSQVSIWYELSMPSLTLPSECKVLSAGHSWTSLGSGINSRAIVPKL